MTRASIAIGFGGNVGTHDEILARFVRAREAVSVLGAVRSAKLYRSAPIGPAQPAFLNTAVLLRVDEMQPTELIATTRELERQLGRVRGERWGPRTIDLDILAWDQRVIATPELAVPHPRLGERRFALVPLADLLGEDASLPGIGVLREAIARVRAQDLEALGDW
ncbi:MAG: 2-amino-4-hydroxy-6-hydroxymethyldihydropteridine diphosphokinase [Kofleriaceae bacterium]|nr:2-amino-4-hydroxy-6-hydroxymethyldihydropteridine diphosphokinase [Kofleriaceae bacterium]